METSTALITAAWVAGAILSVGMIFAFIRVVAGPTLADRVVAMDALATMIIGALVLVSIITGTAMLLDIALTIALVVFLGTIAMATTIERGIFK